MSPCTIQLERECKHKQLNATQDLMGIRRKSHNMLHASSVPRQQKHLQVWLKDANKSFAAEDKTNSILEQKHHTDVLIVNLL